MEEVQWCIQAVSDLRSRYSDSEWAYAARSRLRRIILRVGRVATSLGSASQSGDGYKLWQSKMESTIDIKSRLDKCCQTLVQVSKSLLQPSEPLNARWRQGWCQVAEVLTAMEPLLQAIDGETPKWETHETNS